MSAQPPGTEEAIPPSQGAPPAPPEPGAKRSMIVATLEKPETMSTLLVEETAIAVEMQAGELIVLLEPSLPVAMMVAMPLERRLSIAVLVAPAVASQ